MTLDLKDFDMCIAVGFVDQSDTEEPGQTISQAIRQGEFKKTARRKSQWGQYLLTVDMRRVLASGTFKLTLLQVCLYGCNSHDNFPLCVGLIVGHF